METNPNFFEHNGHLYRDGEYKNPLRTDYARHHGRIDTGAELRASLRAGPYVFPGGYPIYFYTSDGAALCYEAVLANLDAVTWSIRNDVSDGWRVIGCDVCYGSGEEDDPDNVWCDHTGELIA